VSGDEPVDVLNYAKESPVFPHEPTSNQWFTEAQFESYRMLGAVSADAIAPDVNGTDGLRRFFETSLEGVQRRSGVSSTDAGAGITTDDRVRSVRSDCAPWESSAQ